MLPAAPLVSPSHPVLDALADVLNGGRRVTVLCGSGCQGAHHELIALGEMLQSPMVHSMRGKEHVEWDNPYDIGMTGLIGFSSGYYAMHDCDVLLMLGTDFDAVVNRTEIAMPPALTAEMAKGFSLYLAKAILDGRGRDVIDLARTNLWR